MEFSDPYAAEDVFDDYYRGTAPGMAGSPSSGYARAREPRPADHQPLLAAAVVSVARHLRVRPPSQVVGTDHDSTLYTFGVFDHQVVGSDDARAPLFSAAVKRFTGEPKLLRVDDPESYREFREGRRRPYVEELALRLRALERAFRMHAADGHGGLINVLGEAVLEAAPRARAGGELIFKSARAECWQDGPEIVCSLRFSTPSGERLLTSGLPLSACVDDTVRAASVLGAEPGEFLGVAAACIKAVGASELMTELREVGSDVFTCCGAEVGVVKLAPCADPRTCAAMSLLQRCQRGDRAACFEVGRMGQTSGGRELFNHAFDELVAAQEAKRIGRFPS